MAADPCKTSKDDAVLEYTDRTVAQIQEIFPGVQLEWLRRKVLLGWNMNRLLRNLISNPADVPMVERKNEPPVEEIDEPPRYNLPATSADTRMRAMRVFRQLQFRSFKEFQNFNAHFEAVVQLVADKFTRVNRKCIRDIVKQCQSNYAPACAILYFAQSSNQWPMDGKQGMRRLKQNFAGWKCDYQLIINSSARPKSKEGSQPAMPTVLWEQVEMVEEFLRVPVPDEELAEADDDWDGPLFDCSTCFNEAPITRAIVCTTNDDHRFCLDCVRGHTAAMLEGGTVLNGLACMANPCDGVIKWENIRDRIERRVRVRMEKRITEEVINLSNLENLERCGMCNYAVVQDEPKEVNKVFNCEMCHAERCRLCDRPWDKKHVGRRCEEVPKADVQDALRQYENMLSEAIIRRCPRCRTPFDKVDGCNKMTCRCKTTQCYLCRESNVEYTHFCIHQGLEGQGKCCDKPCRLFSNAQEHDQQVIAELQRRINQDERIAEEVRARGEIGGNAPRFVALPPEAALAALVNLPPGAANEALARHLLAVQGAANREQQRAAVADQPPHVAADLV